jgi:hypothetical protein
MIDTYAKSRVGSPYIRGIAVAEDCKVLCDNGSSLPPIDDRCCSIVVMGMLANRSEKGKSSRCRLPSAG